MEDSDYLEARIHLKKYRIHLLDISSNEQVHISRALHEAYAKGWSDRYEPTKNIIFHVSADGFI